MVAKYSLIAAGGALGASLRWLVGTALETDGFPWAIFLVNVFGCALLGALMAQQWKHARARLWLHDFGGIGFCGGLTTMSSFAVGVVDLTDSGRPEVAVAYVLASVVGGAACLVVAAMAVRNRGVRLVPLEERP